MRGGGDALPEIAGIRAFPVDTLNDAVTLALTPKGAAGTTIGRPRRPVLRSVPAGNDGASAEIR